MQLAQLLVFSDIFLFLTCVVGCCVLLIVCVCWEGSCSFLSIFVGLGFFTSIVGKISEVGMFDYSVNFVIFRPTTLLCLLK